MHHYQRVAKICAQVFYPCGLAGCIKTKMNNNMKTTFECEQCEVAFPSAIVLRMHVTHTHDAAAAAAIGSRRGSRRWSFAIGIIASLNPGGGGLITGVSEEGSVHVEISFAANKAYPGHALGDEVHVKYVVTADATFALGVKPVKALAAVSSSLVSPPGVKKTSWRSKPRNPNPHKGSNSWRKKGGAKTVKVPHAVAAPVPRPRERAPAVTSFGVISSVTIIGGGVIALDSSGGDETVMFPAGKVYPGCAVGHRVRVKYVPGRRPYVISVYRKVHQQKKAKAAIVRTVAPVVSAVAPSASTAHVASVDLLPAHVVDTELTPAAEEWICGVCTFVNSAAGDSCDLCATPRTASS